MVVAERDSQPCHREKRGDERSGRGERIRKEWAGREDTEGVGGERGDGRGRIQEDRIHHNNIIACGNDQPVE